MILAIAIHLNHREAPLNISSCPLSISAGSLGYPMTMITIILLQTLLCINIPYSSRLLLSAISRLGLFFISPTSLFPGQVDKNCTCHHRKAAGHLDRCKPLLEQGQKTGVSAFITLSFAGCVCFTFLFQLFTFIFFLVDKC